MVAYQDYWERHRPKQLEQIQLLVAAISRRPRIRLRHTIRYDTIAEFNVDSKAEYSALSSTRSQKKKLKQTTPVPLYSTVQVQDLWKRWVLSLEWKVEGVTDCENEGDDCDEVISNTKDICNN